MGMDHGGLVSTREDRISDLPDELLHYILHRLRSTRAAARTSVLARRWRGLWAQTPAEIYLYDEPWAASFLDSVDAALAACSVPTVARLEIAVSTNCYHVPASRVAPWLRFASQRLAGALYLEVRKCYRARARCDRSWRTGDVARARPLAPRTCRARGPFFLVLPPDELVEERFGVGSAPGGRWAARSPAAGAAVGGGGL
ncbi:unnamed protein product [Urochloa humidicola]